MPHGRCPYNWAVNSRTRLTASPVPRTPQQDGWAGSIDTIFLEILLSLHFGLVYFEPVAVAVAAVQTLPQSPRTRHLPCFIIVFINCSWQCLLLVSSFCLWFLLRLSLLFWKFDNLLLVHYDLFVLLLLRSCLILNLPLFNFLVHLLLQLFQLLLDFLLLLLRQLIRLLDWLFHLLLQLLQLLKLSLNWVELLFSLLLLNILLGLLRLL